MKSSSNKENRKLSKFKGRSSSVRFLMIKHEVLQSSEFSALSPFALKLLIEVASNFNGKNNGDLSATYSTLKKRGWKSSGTLAKAKKELLKNGWLIPTRLGGRNRCSLFAVSWNPVDECNGKLEHPAERVASNLWKTQIAVVSGTT